MIKASLLSWTNWVVHMGYIDSRSTERFDVKQIQNIIVNNKKQFECFQNSVCSWTLFTLYITRLTNWYYNRKSFISSLHLLRKCIFPCWSITHYPCYFNANTVWYIVYKYSINYVNMRISAEVGMKSLTDVLLDTCVTTKPKQIFN